MRIAAGLLLGLWASAAVTADYTYCTLCHGANAGGNQNIAAPALKGIEPWYLTDALAAYRGSLRGNAFDKDPSGSEMHSVTRQITAAEEPEVLKFLASLPATKATATVEGNAARGKKLYAETCAACHGPRGQGNADLHAPNLTRLNDWYIVSTFAKYRSGTRGADPVDIWAFQMHQIVGTLPADYAIADVARYLATESRN
ncbi:MAG: c-type cytochrome [Steroidobacteraceae bacterium]